MDHITDAALVNSPNISSVLKPPKPRMPLKDLMAAEEDNTASRKRRVSFANVNKIKEFSAGAESMVVCQTPAYEEPFYLSSDSSYPSGVDGWTPAKGQSESTLGKSLIYPEKENLSTQSVRMSTGMNLTSVIGGSAQSSRYSVNGMELTEVLNSNETHFSQHSRHSEGMSLTSVMGHPLQSTRYSVGGMDLTGIASQQSFADHRTRLSAGMDFTNVIGHSTHNTRYSVNGMDFTEVANPQQTLFGQTPTRYSVGMDMTNVVGLTKTVRYSCNDMDMTEAVNPYWNQNQTGSGGISANGSMNDSDALELTDAASGIQFSAVSPKIGLAENVLYSVNNSRYSVNGMDMTRAAGSHMSSTGRKSSRYSLVNMDLTGVSLDNSCDDLEFTQAIGDPRMKVGSRRNSTCAMDFTEALGSEGAASLSATCMDQTSVVGDMLEYSADTESSLKLTKSTINRFEPPTFDKENILPNQNLDFVVNVPAPLPQENLISVESKLNNLSTCVPENLPQITKHENENSQLQNRMISNNSQYETYEQVLNEQPHYITNSQKDPDALQVNTVTSIFSDSRTLNKELQEDQGSPEMTVLQEECRLTQNNDSVRVPLPQKESSIVEGVETTSLRDISSVNNKTEKVLESSVGTLIKNSQVDKDENKTFSLNISNCHNIVLNVDTVVKNNAVEELKLNESGLNVDSFEGKSSSNETDTTLKSDSQSVNKEDVVLKQQANDNANGRQCDDDAMEVSITDNIGFEDQDGNDTKRSEAGISNTTLTCSPGAPSLSESGLGVEGVQIVGGKETNNGVENIMPSSVFNDCEKKNWSDTINLEEENLELKDVNDTAKDRSFELNISSNTSTNLSLRASLCSKNINITMTRGRSRSFVSTTEKSFETDSNGNCSVGHDEISNVESTPGSPLKMDEDRLNQTENNFEHETSPLQAALSHEKRGKRSFEIALEPEDDTEESPKKQLCLSREEPHSEYLINVSAPSLLMDTVAMSNETVQQVEETSEQSKLNWSGNGTKNQTSNPSSKTMSDTKVDFSLRLDGSLVRNMSDKPLHQEVIDLCESSFDVTATEVRQLLDNSQYKTREYEVLDKQNENLTCIVNKRDISSSDDVSCDREILNVEPQLDLKTEPCANTGLNTVGTEVLREEMDSMCIDPLPENHKATQIKSRSRRKQERVRMLEKNSYAADFIPGLVEIQFSVDLLDNVNNVSYRTISSGSNTEIAEYFMRQARNYVLPKKGCDLILHLQSPKTLLLARLARHISLICKYHNGSIKGNILTLEVASCRNHFWTVINVNIKHPQYFNATDITISSQKIGELKLSHIRKVFTGIEKNEDQLLNFAKAMTAFQYNN